MDAGVVSQHNIIVGEVFASRAPAVVSTVLGSCVAACLLDPERRIGGMNHFMLPQCSHGTDSAAFGINAMELLINKLMKLGGDRRRFVAKVFGGGNVLSLRGDAMQVGQRNVEFVLDFLKTEGIPIAARRIGGQTGVKLSFVTHLGKAFVKPLPNRMIAGTLKYERHYLEKVQSTRRPTDVTLFS